MITFTFTQAWSDAETRVVFQGAGALGDFTPWLVAGCPSLDTIGTSTQRKAFEESKRYFKESVTSRIIPIAYSGRLINPVSSL